jgi:hypothetical protein
VLFCGITFSKKQIIIGYQRLISWILDSGLWIEMRMARGEE